MSFSKLKAFKDIKATSYTYEENLEHSKNIYLGKIP